MRVRVTQLWREGRQIDGRELVLGDCGVAGTLRIEAKDGERLARLTDDPLYPAKPRDLVPKLWAPAIVKLDGKAFRLRGVQKVGGRLFHQEWDCYLLSRQD